MIENIHLAQKLLRQYNPKGVSPRCLLKIDLRKAYDSVNWDYLKNVLKGLDFPAKFIGWIMKCISTPTYSIVLNGDTENSDFNYHLKCGPLKITHLAFADDLMLFARGDFMSVRILMNCLSKFEDVLGLRMNASKSSMFTTSIHGNDLEGIEALTNIPIGSLSFRYLGIPIAARKLKISSYNVLFNKLSAYICAWTKSSLSYVDRMELVRAILQGVVCFWPDFL
ncbi:uncharacterized protein LOC111382204 [Olea europaea var. sylvestris]|uniref:uncharacterized protein LOC111382204 n=1 Tax=Olea europaea var. sylvestris TaxID=158386 RepID=UPI000C1D01AA|nr:uncharacterized protein LOC111382204 [Olea europaea var. sylvestris]